MIHRDQRGSLVLPLIVVTTLLLGALGFGFWAFAGMSDYKNNVDQKVSEAVAVAVEQNSLEKEADFAEQLKNPFDTYTGPSAYGSLKLSYPKTWSAYIDETGNSATPVSGYLHPDFVPSTNNRDINYALRFEVTSQTYDQEAAKFSSYITNGSLKSSAYRAPNVPSALGSKLTGAITPQKQGILVLLPLRDKTIKIWTEGNQFTADFNKVLENLTFVP